MSKKWREDLKHCEASLRLLTITCNGPGTETTSCWEFLEAKVVPLVWRSPGSSLVCIYLWLQTRMCGSVSDPDALMSKTESDLFLTQWPTRAQQSEASWLSDLFLSSEIVFFFKSFDENAAEIVKAFQQERYFKIVQLFLDWQTSAHFYFKKIQPL